MTMIRRTKTPALTTRMIKGGFICPYNGDLMKTEDEIYNEVKRLLDEKVYKMSMNTAMKTIRNFCERRASNY